MRELTYVQALNEAFMEEMARDATVVVYGEDAEVSFTFQATKGLLEKFGPERVRDTPICENLLVGLGVGAHCCSSGSNRYLLQAGSKSFALNRNRA